MKIRQDFSLCILTCANFEPELSYLLRNGSYPDVTLITLPVNCTGPLIKPEICHELESCKKKYQKVIALGSSCLYGVNQPAAGNGNIVPVKRTQCFELLLNPAIVSHLIGHRYFMVSNGWFNDYPNHIAKWGFDADKARQFFRLTADRILLLDTGIPGDHERLLKDLSQYMGLPFEILPIGLDHCRMILDKEVTAWRNDTEKNLNREFLARSTKQAADYSLAFEQIKTLAGLTDEPAIVTKMLDLLNLLYAPKKLTYIPNQDGRVERQNMLTLEKPSPDDPEPETSGVQNRIESQDNRFVFDLIHYHEILGTVEVEGISFPEYFSHYKELSDIIGKIFGLAIANARKFSIIEKNKHELEINAQLLSSLNATKDKFFSIVAHDLRSPFNTILGFLELLESEYNEFSEDERKKYISLIRSTTLNTYRLTDNLLKWSGLQTGKTKILPVVCNLQDLIDELIDLLKPSADHKQISLTAGKLMDYTVLADRDALLTVIRNLINNAIKFTPPGGAVTVQQEIEEGMVRVSVTDTGIGISATDLENLFRPDQAKSTPGTMNEKGTGLGLMLCKEFVEKNGGKICAESAPGKGSSFHFTVPLAASVQPNT